MKTSTKNRSGFLLPALFAIILASLVLSFPLQGCAVKVVREDTAERNEEATPDAQSQLALKVAEIRAKAEELALRIHQLTNEQRRHHGLKSLEWDGELAAIAYQHSSDMARRNYFDHTSPEGKSFADRYREHGYQKNTRVGDVVYGGAENLFLNNVARSYTYDKDTGEVYSYEFSSLEEIARSTVEGWMQSPGHRENILTPFTREGIGVYVTDDGKIYITQNFS
ncbi:MAG: CAP domain-containing protein [Candidatus Geothermincolales bacterium]